MFKEAVSEYIWLATCQGKIYENKPPFSFIKPSLVPSCQIIIIPPLPQIQHLFFLHPPNQSMAFGGNFDILCCRGVTTRGLALQEK